MSKETAEPPTVTYKEAIKLLNGLCEGLGGELSKLKISSMFKTLPCDSLSAFALERIWYESKYGSQFWNDIHELLCEIESGAGIKKH